ncbi:MULTISPECIES: hypothetical protein [Streptomyces]|uniref:DoxX-like protein n=1 Tax=Streptomyces spororaveus TaxID=284039 RepID=A0ABQ3T9J8_9ACTN|nr:MULTISPECIES: hypothetical protein [Streptomyces]MCM9082527.1 hypothetical protein [Streptomyces spororaveus]MCX5302897.1 hypothetical protein [Streptomyces sp. NBC_00160]GHI77054.1 hypothetical protein Sspor_26150 [Streptomyces spororaveus]
MTEQQVQVPTRRHWVATAAGAAVLLVLHTVAGFFLLNALLTESEGPWDRSVTQTVRLMAGLGLAVELLAAAVTAVCVNTGRLRRWWYAPAAAVVLTALIRMVFAPQP